MMHIFIAASGDAIRPGATGQAVPGYTATILDPDGNEVPTGEVGEIYFMPASGPGTTYYYLGAEAKDREGWETIGDLGYVDADGFLFIADRVKDMVITGGENVYPAEVENAIVAHPAVVEAAVIGVPDQRWGEVGRAFVRYGSGGGPSREELREFLLARLAKYKVPVHVDVVEQLPRTGSGKVRKAELRRLPVSGSPVAPAPQRFDGDPDRVLTAGGPSGRGDER